MLNLCFSYGEIRNFVSDCKTISRDNAQCDDRQMDRVVSCQRFRGQLTQPGDSQLTPAEDTSCSVHSNSTGAHLSLCLLCGICCLHSKYDYIRTTFKEFDTFCFES